MKSTKNLLLTIAMPVIVVLNVHAGTSDLLKKTQGPGFELYNKAAQTISVAVLIDGQLSTADVAPSGKFLKDVDTSKTIRLGIYNKPTKGISTAFISGAITPQPDVVYELKAPGKTKYVTYNPSKSSALYPQTGPLMGLKGKTESGYPLGSNLQQGQIVLKK
jgi:hypothetical protein